jgi:hypothetical protein
MSKSLINSQLERNGHFEIRYHWKEPIRPIKQLNKITFILASNISILNKKQKHNLLGFPSFRQAHLDPRICLAGTNSDCGGLGISSPEQNIKVYPSYKQ